MKKNIKRNVWIFLFYACGQPTQEIPMDYVKDTRDQQVYKIASFGADTWMVENLRYATEQAYVIPNVPENYGLLYFWRDACRACPDGWHLPSHTEWQELAFSLGLSRDSVESRSANKAAKIGKKLKRSEAWGEAENLDSGWDALPSGLFPYMGFKLGATYAQSGEMACFWTSTLIQGDSTNGTVWMRELYKNDNVLYDGPNATRYGLSVRCVKNRQ